MIASHRSLLLVGLLALLQVSPARVETWTYADGVFAVLPARQASAVLDLLAPIDLDGDGIEETVRVQAGRAEILAGGASAWQSPPDWQVAQAVVGDLNRDGRPEAVLLVWRPFAPWPIDRYLKHPGRIAGFHNAEGLSSHVILIGWARGAYRELWAGSAMVDPFAALAAADLDGDGRQELAALEGRYADPRGAPARALTAWEWNGFGFTLLARQPGRFAQLAVAVVDGRAVLRTQR